MSQKLSQSRSSNASGVICTCGISAVVSDPFLHSYECRAHYTAMTPEVTIQRNSQNRKWEIVIGSHRTPTIFPSCRDERRVINYIRAKAQGPVRVMVLG